MNRNILFVMLSVILVISGCKSQADKKSAVAADKKFILPTVPAIMQSADQRAAYIVAHYWENFDFSDTSLISRPDITEQAFTNYIDMFPHTTLQVVEESVDAMLDKALNANVAMFNHFTDLYERYFYDPNSPFRQEDYYIIVLKSVVSNDKLDEINKVRPNYQLDVALKNRVGDIASDFSFELKSGKVMKLSGVSSEHTILFFNNPDCHDCARVKEILSKLNPSKVKIVAIYPDEDVALWLKTQYPASWVNGRAINMRDNAIYDLRAIPTLYLLDRDKKVVLKDAKVEQIVDFVNNKLQ